MPRSDAHPGGTGGVGAPSRRDDRSGLIDIRALSSLVDAQRRGPSASASSLALPTFSTPWTLLDTPRPQPEAKVAPPSPRRAAGPDNRPLYVMLASLSLAVASLGAYVLLRPSPAPAVVVETVPAPVVPTKAAEPEPPVIEPAMVAAASEPDEASDEAEAAEAEPEPEAKPSRSHSPRPRAHREPRPKPVVEPPPKKDTGVSVECVLDPSACKGSGRALPATPSAAQIRDAMAPVKPTAKACGSRHSGRSGETVRVKLSAKGSTGAITSARALDDHADTALGRCVADALSKATLPRFSKAQAGIVYAIRL
ncbi:MAG: hypothetical protein KC501_10630 [Myxococcales bacterium]|nr:hypothetical protein [Myxococcales bacterium]